MDPLSHLSTNKHSDSVGEQIGQVQTSQEGARIVLIERFPVAPLSVVSMGGGVDHHTGVTDGQRAVSVEDTLDYTYGLSG